jgi:hypothetical protein
MCGRPDNFVFLGDSLTEGVGSGRISYVSELASILRSASRTPSGEGICVNEFRLRSADRASFNGFVDFNVAGYLSQGEEEPTGRNLWLWNLASEGRTVESDFRWLPLINTLRPNRVIIFRGSLESIVRPATPEGGSWPWWVPASWRGYASMDPRCYFSTTWWRRLKQKSVDALKQRTRLHLLRQQPGVPLMDADAVGANLRSLLMRLRELDVGVLLLGLLPVDGGRFPMSPQNFNVCNQRLQQLGASLGFEFFDWGADLARESAHKDLFYRDGFHPNRSGARALASKLFEHLFAETLRDRKRSG